MTKHQFLCYLYCVIFGLLAGAVWVYDILQTFVLCLTCVAFALFFWTSADAYGEDDDEF